MRAEVDSQSRQEPIADESADDADAEIGDKAEARAAQNLPGEPARNDADDKDDQKMFARQGKSS
jgi:hypothetical protein